MDINKTLRTRIIKPDGEEMDWQQHETNSIVIAFANILFNQFSNGDQSPQITDITGTDREVDSAPGNFQTEPGSGTATRGVHFGTGTASVSYSDSDLANRLTSNVTYNDGTASITQTTTQTDISLTRTMDNTGSSTIGIEEAGLFVKAVDVGSSDRVFLIARDTLSTTVDLAPNESIQGEYTWTQSI